MRPSNLLLAKVELGVGCNYENSHQYDHIVGTLGDLGSKKLIELYNKKHADKQTL